jgi:hypothetical protein
VKATQEQRRLIKKTFDSQLAAMNLSPNATCGLGDCWILLDRYLRSRSEDRPVGCGTAREWLFPGLNDSHLETAFRQYLNQRKSGEINNAATFKASTGEWRQ